MNTASTTPYKIILHLGHRGVTINPFAVTQAGFSILRLEHWLEQLQTLAVKGGLSQGIIELVREGKKEAVQLKRDVYAAIGYAEYVLKDVAYELIKGLKKFLNDTVLAYTRVQRLFTNALNKEKQIAE